MMNFHSDVEKLIRERPDICYEAVQETQAMISL